MRTMRVAICDDDIRIALLIESIVKDYQRENKVKLDIDVFDSGEELIKYMENGNQVDLLFLDIVFSSGMSGVEIGDTIRNRLDNQILKLVYVSGHSSYDRQLFAYQPMNFIEKPVSKEKVYENIAMARRLLNISEDIFYYPKGNGKDGIMLGDILYFESYVRQIVIHSRKGDIKFYGKMKDIEKWVEGKRFVRIHRSYIVNYDYIVHIGYEQVILSDSTELGIGETYIKKVRQAVMDFE